MSTNLQQATKQSRVSTLPDDLKAIAEAMLAEKFGEEVVEQKAQTSFQRVGDTIFAANGVDELTAFDGTTTFVEPDVGDRRPFGRRDLGEISVRVEPWSRTRIAEMEISYPSYDVLMTALRSFDMRNIRTRDRELVMHPEFYHFLMRDRDVSVNFIRFDQTGIPRERGAKVSDGQLFGCQVYITPKVRHAMLIARF